MSWLKRLIEGPSDEERLRDEFVKRAAAIPPDEWQPEPYGSGEGWHSTWFTTTTPGGVVLELRLEYRDFGDYPSDTHFSLDVDGAPMAHAVNDNGHPVSRLFWRVHNHWAPRIKAAEAARRAEATAAEAARKRRLLDDW